MVHILFNFNNEQFSTKSQIIFKTLIKRRSYVHIASPKHILLVTKKTHSTNSFFLAKKSSSRKTFLRGVMYCVPVLSRNLFCHKINFLSWREYLQEMFFACCEQTFSHLTFFLGVIRLVTAPTSTLEN